ncbi:hypothetical protein [Pseudarthrobacter oxydans]|uniref:hypothetical protein n=1 Tax=Pseudarthrobacter oxydans TaxID=1671 RepID=UPI0035EE99DC
MTHESGGRPSPQEAHQALAEVAESRRALAPFIHSPKWLYPAQGIGMALFIIGLALFNSYGWATIALGLSMVVFCVLPVLQSRRSRVILDVYTHPGSWLVGLLYLGAFAALVAAALVIHTVTGNDLVVYLAAFLAFVLTVLCGPAMETKLARWLRASH